MISCKHSVKLPIAHFTVEKGYKFGVLSGMPVKCRQCERHLRLGPCARYVGRIVVIMTLILAISCIYLFFSASIRSAVSEMSALPRIIIPYALGLGWLIPYFAYKAIVGRYGPWEEIGSLEAESRADAVDGSPLQEPSKTKDDTISDDLPSP